MIVSSQAQLWICSFSVSLQGLYMIRFHSFYPWHSHGDYMNLCNDKDLRMLPWVQEFKWVSPSLMYTWSYSLLWPEAASSILRTANLTCTPRPPSCPTSRNLSRTTSLWSTSTVLEYWSGKTDNIEILLSEISWFWVLLQMLSNSEWYIVVLLYHKLDLVHPVHLFITDYISIKFNTTKITVLCMLTI